MARTQRDTAYMVGQLAELARVSVRTLHHYDSLGLLTPSKRSDGGYRLYDREDLERLQQILFFRELGFSLDEIRDLMMDPAFDRREALAVQRELLAEKVLQTQAMITAIDRALAAEEGAIRMTDEEMFEVFGDFDPKEYEAEAEQRWGDGDAYKESARRTKAYTKADWERIKAEGGEVTGRMVALYDEGVEPTDPRAMDVADEARLQIDKWFYPCSREMHVCLGEMYVADPRFTKVYDAQRQGLAQWFCDAIKANAARE